MWGRKKGKKREFYHFWLYDHDQEGYDHDLTTSDGFSPRATF